MPNAFQFEEEIFILQSSFHGDNQKLCSFSSSDSGPALISKPHITISSQTISVKVIISILDNFYLSCHSYLVLKPWEEGFFFNLRHKASCC